jgi:LPXTG-motif cell wall-anchored protein
MKAIRAALLLLGCITLLGAMAAQAQPLNKATKVTFDQPVAVPGMVLPAGTYTFTILDMAGSRNIVQIFNEDRTKLVTTILAIHNYRLEPTGETVIHFAESPAGTPQALKAWFYPCFNYGVEFVYPEKKAMEIAEASKEVVPAEKEEVTSIQGLKSVPLVAVTPEQKEEPLEQAIETEPPAGETAEKLPTTGSEMPLIALFGVIGIAAGFGLKRFAVQGR